MLVHAHVVDGVAVYICVWMWMWIPRKGDKRGVGSKRDPLLRSILEAQGVLAKQANKQSTQTSKQKRRLGGRAVFFFKNYCAANECRPRKSFFFSFLLSLLSRIPLSVIPLHRVHHNKEQRRKEKKEKKERKKVPRA